MKLDYKFIIAALLVFASLIGASYIKSENRVAEKMQQKKELSKKIEVVKKDSETLISNNKQDLKDIRKDLDDIIEDLDEINLILKEKSSEAEKKDAEK